MFIFQLILTDVGKNQQEMEHAKEYIMDGL